MGNMYCDSRILFIACLLFAVGNNAMENNMMVEIKSEKDLEQFTGKVVAFDMLLPRDPFTSDIGCDLDCYGPFHKYGYVDGKGQGNRRMNSLDGHLLSKEDTCRMFPGLNDSYMLHTLLRKDAFDCTSHILHKGHFRSGLEMRNIIQAEAALIFNAIKNREAKFSYWNEEPSLLLKILQFLVQAQ